ncbi:MAG: hypothetical protein JRF63_14070, partial [Deltaproteobacteria bacterium]|nr:hypothetical protein [Deltaproteobacteria bacterium]
MQTNPADDMLVGFRSDADGCILADIMRTKSRTVPYWQPAVLALFAVLLTTCRGPAPLSPDKPSLLVVDIEQAPRILDQCARNTPAGDKHFEPDQVDVDAADAALAKFYEGIEDKVSAYFYEPFETFFRQYVGLEVEGRDQIYVSGFHQSATDEPAEPFDSCDEGKLFFGAQYDVEAGEIVDFEFNSKDDYRFYIDVEDHVREV